MYKRKKDLNLAGSLLAIATIIAVVVLNILNIVGVIHAVTPNSVTTHQVILALIWAVFRFILIKIGAAILMFIAVIIGVL